jgi:hypothetical protein
MMKQVEEGNKKTCVQHYRGCRNGQFRQSWETSRLPAGCEERGVLDSPCHKLNPSSKPRLNQPLNAISSSISDISDIAIASLDDGQPLYFAAFLL